MPPTSRPTRAVWDTVAAPHRLNLGLHAMEPSEPWLVIDDDYVQDLAEKHRLLRDKRSQVFVELERSRAAQAEARNRVIETLLTHYADEFELNGSQFCIRATGEEFDLTEPHMPALEVAARCTQEDLVVMEERPEGWCLTAASVCFPTRWDLPTQLGLPMTAIHERVPGYQEQLNSSSNRFFDGMKPGLVFKRGNWSLMDDPALFQPGGKMQTRERSDLDASNAGQKIWLRVEHQTLQRLPTTGAILFGIRIHRTRLDAVAETPDAARTLLASIDTMDADMQLYKSLALVRGAATAYLRDTLV
ncbi:MAG: DUF3445 domain-containing protein [Myxococcota bacterium]